MNINEVITQSYDAPPTDDLIENVESAELSNSDNVELVKEDSSIKKIALMLVWQLKHCQR